MRRGGEAVAVGNTFRIYDPLLCAAGLVCTQTYEPTSNLLVPLHAGVAASGSSRDYCASANRVDAEAHECAGDNDPDTGVVLDDSAGDAATATNHCLIVPLAAAWAAGESPAARSLLYQPLPC